MLIQERVKYSNLPIKQLRVIESILNDLESNSFLSGQEICDKFKISFSSLTRMAKGLGFKGFPQLKKEIEIQYKNEASPTKQAEAFIDKSSKSNILDTLIDNEINNLLTLKRNLNDETLKEVSKEIYRAQRVFIIGIGQLSSVVNKFSKNLEMLRISSKTLTNIGFSKELELYQLKESDLVIITSINKELKEMLELLGLLKTNKIKSILLSDKKFGNLHKEAHYSLYAPAKGNGSVNDLAPLHILTNILESYVFSLDEDLHLKKIKNVENSWSSLPIFLQ